MKYRITSWLAAALMLLGTQASAASLSDIQVSNGDRQARITLSFVGDPEYSFTPQGKRAVALDIKQTGVLQGCRCSLAVIIWSRAFVPARLRIRNRCVCWSI